MAKIFAGNYFDSHDPKQLGAESSASRLFTLTIPTLAIVLLLETAKD